MSTGSPDESIRDRITVGDSSPGTEHQWSAFLAGDSILLENPDGSPFSHDLRTRMAGSDIAVVNLEGPVTTREEPLLKSGPVNRSVPATPDRFVDAGIDAVTLANNHTMDYGPAGLADTVSACERAGLGTCGAGPDVDAALEPYRTAVAGGSLEIAVMSLCEREFGVADDDTDGTAWINHPRAIAGVEAAAANTDVLIVAIHGGIEYVPLPPPGFRERCKAVVHAGADVVVGHHPHVPQGWELLDGVPVFYSLGNFVFDQQRRPNTSRGLALDLEFSGTTPVSVSLVPTRLAGGRVHELIDPDPRRTFLDHLHELATVTAEDLEPHWQEVAERVFLQRHAQMLRKAGGGDPIAMARHPATHLRGGALWDPDDRRYPMLALLNLVRNESHREVIETALSVRTGVAEDRRSPAVAAQVREFFEETEDRPVYDPPSLLERGIRLSARRLREAVARVVPRPAS